MRLIKKMPDPKEAKLEQMIIIGLKATYGKYEWFCYVEAEGKEIPVWNDLKKLTFSISRHEDEDPVLHPLLSIIEHSASFAGEIGVISGKYSQ